MITWVDIETTGLDLPSAILEVAIIVTNDDLELEGGRRWLRPMEDRNSLVMDDFVGNMHTKSGLLADCESLWKRLQWRGEDSLAQYDILNFTNIHEFLSSGKWLGNVMAGNSITFDRSQLTMFFGREKMDKLFHYRNIDVSTLKETAKMDAPWIHDEWKDICKEKGEKVHRGMSDIATSIQEYKFYRSAMRTGAWSQ